MPRRTLRIHGPHGVVEHADPIADPAKHRPRRTGADQVPVTEVMTRDVVCAAPNLALDALVDVMAQGHLGCIPVVTENLQPVGMVTKFDIVQLFSESPLRVRPTAADVMMPLAITLDDHATVAHAAALMASEDMHHVMIVSDRRLIGVVSTMDITRWLARNDELPR